jgi:hypothetical protein
MQLQHFVVSSFIQAFQDTGSNYVLVAGRERYKTLHWDFPRSQGQTYGYLTKSLEASKNDA